MGLEEELGVFESEEDGVEDSEEGEQAEEKSYGFGEFEQHAPAPLVVYCTAIWFRGFGLVCRAGEEDEISVGIDDDEGAAAPGLLLQGLAEAYSGGLIRRKELFDFVCGCEGERSREELFALTNIANEH